MRSILNSAAHSAVPVVSAVAAIATVRAADLPFPAALSLSAWPHWVVLSSLVFAYASAGYWLHGGLSAKRAPATPSPGNAA